MTLTFELGTLVLYATRGLIQVNTSANLFKNLSFGDKDMDLTFMHFHEILSFKV